MTTVPAAAQLQLIAQGREAEIYDWGDGRVLRLFLTPRDDATLDREVAAMSAARVSLPSVPAVFGRESALGRQGIVMERVDGPDLVTRIEKAPWTIGAAGRINGDLQARLHAAVAPDSLPTTKDRITRITASPRIPPAMGEWARAQLVALPDGDRICHGDLHPANIIASTRGPVIIDWPNATRGDPDADVARTILMLSLGALPPGTPIYIRVASGAARPVIRFFYKRAYRRVRPYDPAHVARWLPIRAVDRLAEDLPGERKQLLSIIEHAMRA